MESHIYLSTCKVKYVVPTPPNMVALYYDTIDGSIFTDLLVGFAMVKESKRDSYSLLPIDYSSDENYENPACVLADSYDNFIDVVDKDNLDLKKWQAVADRRMSEATQDGGNSYAY